jgi:hypothetical protein
MESNRQRYPLDLGDTGLCLRFNEKTRDMTSFPFDRGRGGSFWLLALRSDRFVCIRCMATPCSSVAKSNPRSTDTIPVDMSVRLAARTSIDGRRGSMVVVLSLIRDCDVRRELVEWRRWRAVRGFVTCPSRVKSRLGSFLLIHRIVSRSLGAKPDLQAFQRYRGASERINVRGMHSQK